MTKSIIETDWLAPVKFQVSSSTADDFYVDRSYQNVKTSLPIMTSFIADSKDGTSRINRNHTWLTHKAGIHLTCIVWHDSLQVDRLTTIHHTSRQVRYSRHLSLSQHQNTTTQANYQFVVGTENSQELPECTVSSKHNEKQQRHSLSLSRLKQLQQRHNNKQSINLICAFHRAGMWSQTRRLGLETDQRRTNVSSRIGQNAQRLSLVSVSDLCVSGLVSVWAWKVSCPSLSQRNCFTWQGCGLSLDVSVSRLIRDVLRSRLGSDKMPNVSVSSRSRTYVSQVSSRSQLERSRAHPCHRGTASHDSIIVEGNGHIFTDYTVDWYVIAFRKTMQSKETSNAPLTNYRSCLPASDCRHIVHSYKRYTDHK